ncbi:MAG: deoxyhypusine synthase family protein [Planctomycetota bacterium]|nr:deoxyhypusine synthase family protein [Planctomycetota bacterium]
MSENIRSYLRRHFRHFNAASLVDAAEAYSAHLDGGGIMLLAMAGAMSTAELGISLAEMIRRGKVHAVSCTGANLEEDVFNLVAHRHYVRAPNYRDLAPGDELKLLERGLNRVTDTCIPEEEAIRRLEGSMLRLWTGADARGERLFPHEFVYRLLRSGELERHYQIDPADSWILAAAERDLPLFVPGWEDSTLGNIYASHVLRGDIAKVHTVRGGIEYMLRLIDWYRKASAEAGIGFFQIGGGIAGDFAICAVPLLRQDLGEEVPLWGYFCQISDSTTSFGSYSGAVPNEKITWEKLGADTPKFIVESDATIVAPLIFSHVLGD